MAGKGIVRDGATGEAVFAGTDVFVSTVLEVLAERGSTAAVLERFPELTPDDVAEALDLAVRAVRSPAAYGARTVTAERVREAALAYGAPVDVEDEVFKVDARLAGLHEEDELLRALRGGLDDVRTGNLVSHEEAMAELYAIVGR